VHVQRDDGDLLVIMLRFGIQPGGRLGVEQAVVTLPGPDLDQIDVAAWRSVPIAEATTIANLPEYCKVITAHLNDDDAEVSIGEGADDLQPVLLVKRTGHAYRLRIPYGNKYPDTFYERVAKAYETAVANGEPPAQAMSNANGVPLTTVHRWVREARRRGVLAPAQKGRKG
jgi:hypothetical protein